MNDCLRTNIFVRYEVKTITCACIFLAARQLKVSVRECVYCYYWSPLSGGPTRATKLVEAI